MRCVIAFLLGTALLRAAAPQFPAAAFYGDTTHVAIVIGQASEEMLQGATKLREPKLRPPFGELFATPGLGGSGGVKTGNSFDVNLTGNFWVRSIVDSFAYNKCEYSSWILAIATAAQRQPY